MKSTATLLRKPDDFEVIGREAVKTLEPALFREAMSRLGTAVHVVTTAGPGGRTGLTATAVCSVSDAPPTLLTCINRRSRAARVLQENGVFLVNTLGADAEAIADVFAGRTGVFSPNRFDADDWTVLATGAPVLTTAVVAFDCRVLAIKVVATHNVVFGAVQAVRLGPAGPALAYRDREYKRFY